jgi:hypothetical protein
MSRLYFLLLCEYKYTLRNEDAVSVKMPADQGEDLPGLDRCNRGRATRACNKLVSKWNVWVP